MNSEKRVIHLAAILALVAIAGIVAPNSYATGVSEDMQFKGTLIAPPPCTIDDHGKRIDVDFGPQVGVNKVDGVNYLQTVPYTIHCDAGVTPWDMTLTLNGSPTSYDSAAIITNIQNLGIQIMQNGQRFILGSTIEINPASPPVIQAVPVKAPGSTLSAGAFEASATLLAIYQ